MNQKQLDAANRLRLALNHAGTVGLSGGVFDGTFCLWPTDKNITWGGVDFFNDIEEVGVAVYTPKINLDGGAGV